jgi:hypothetical protein
MTSPSLLVKGLLLAILSTYWLSTFAQETNFTDCRSITDRQARYACYDRIEASEVSTVVELEKPAPRANPDNLPVVSLPTRNREVVSDEPAMENQQVTDPGAGQEEIDDFGRSTETANSSQSTRIVEGDEGQRGTDRYHCLNQANRPGHVSNYLIQRSEMAADDHQALFPQGRRRSQDLPNYLGQFLPLDVKTTGWLYSGQTRQLIDLGPQPFI